MLKTSRQDAGDGNIKKDKIRNPRITKNRNPNAKQGDISKILYK